MSRSIFVLGPPRSGSSCIAGAMHRMGINMGEGHLQVADVLNPGGYYEDLRWQRITKQIAGRQYTIKDPMTLTGAQRTAYAKLAHTCSENLLWGVKSPRIAFVFHYIWPLLDDVRVVAMKRDPESMALSFHNHSQVAYHHNFRLTRKQVDEKLALYQSAIEERISDFPGPVYVADYDRLFDEPMAGLKALHNFCYSGIGHLSNRDLAPAMTWLNEGYRHYYADHHADVGLEQGKPSGNSRSGNGWTRKRPCCRD